MANAAITAIVTELGLITTIDTTATNSFQEDVMYELARGAMPGVLGQVGSAFIAVTANTARYSIPTSAGARCPLALFYDTAQLLLIRKAEAWEYDQAWRDAPAHVVVGFIYDPEDRPSFALVPPPYVDGTTIGGNTPTNVTTWPDKNITIIYSNTDLTFPGTTYDDLKLPIGLETLAREFGRDSDHQDALFSKTCHGMADFFFAMFSPLGKPT